MHLHKANTGQQVDSLVTCLVSSSITPAVNRNHFSNFRIPRKKNIAAPTQARRTAPNKQASTSILLYRQQTFFFFILHQSARDVHLFVAVPSRVYNSTSPKTSITDPLTAFPPGQFCCTGQCSRLLSGKTTTAHSTASLQPPHLPLKSTCTAL